jgi:predicted DCC family thiol-disulfide oxidoreductase YuxK
MEKSSAKTTANVIITESNFSHRADPSVPEFPDTGCVVFVDGTCGACSKAARLIARFDHQRTFLICPIGSPLGRSVLLHYGQSPDDPDSWLYLEHGRAYESMEAIIKVGWRLGGVGRLLMILSMLPKSAQRRLYRFIAQNRYRFMGRVDICAIPDPQLQKRLIG